jgi:hypothetical protein
MNTFTLILKYLAVFVLAIFVGTFSMMGLHLLSGVIWPEFGIDAMPANPEALEAFMASMPLGPKVAVLLSHWGGTVLGAITAVVASGRRQVWPGLVLGAWFTIGGVANNAMLPAPFWMEAVDVVGYIPLAYLVSRPLVKPGA